VNAFKPIRPTAQQLAALPEHERAVWEELAEREEAHEQRIQDLILESDWDQALCLVGSEDRARILIAACEDTTIDEARVLLEEWWSVTEAWSGDPTLRAGMLEQLHRARPVRVFGPDDFGFPEVGVLTLYRGNLGEKPGTGSWTLDLAVAEKFAAMAKSPRGQFLGMDREDGWPTVWQATAAATDVDGYFNDRGEEECVITDAVYLHDVIAIREWQR